MKLQNTMNGLLTVAGTLVVLLGMSTQAQASLVFGLPEPESLGLLGAAVVMALVIKRFKK